MRRVLGADNSMATLERMLREKWVVKLLLPRLPEGSSEADALRLHRKLRQQGRAPCSFLDRELGIVR